MSGKMTALDEPTAIQYEIWDQMKRLQGNPYFT